MTTYVVTVAVAFAIVGWLLYRRRQRIARETLGQLPPAPERS